MGSIHNMNYEDRLEIALIESATIRRLVQDALDVQQLLPPVLTNAEASKRENDAWELVDEVMFDLGY